MMQQTLYQESAPGGTRYHLMYSRPSYKIHPSSFQQKNNLRYQMTRSSSWLPPYTKPRHGQSRIWLTCSERSYHKMKFWQDKLYAGLRHMSSSMVSYTRRALQEFFCDVSHQRKAGKSYRRSTQKILDTTHQQDQWYPKHTDMVSSG